MLTLVMTWPLVTELNSHLIGNNIDVWLNPWATWWTKQALTKGLDLFHTDMIYFGKGTSLFFHSFSYVNSALELLLQPLVGTLPAYNIVVMLTRVLSGYGMYCLVHYLTRQPAAAFFSGLVFAFIPYMMYETAHLIVVSTQWMPFFMLHLIRLVREQRRRSILPATAFFVLTALSSWHLMVFLTFLAALFLLVSLVFERSSWSLSTWRDLVLMGLAALIVLAPFFHLFIRELTLEPQPYMEAVDGIGTDLAAFFLPAAGNPVLNVVSKDLSADRPFYLGFLAVGLGLVSVVMDWRRSRSWVIVAVVFFVLTLGTQPQFNGHDVGPKLFWGVIISGIHRHPFRFNVLVAFGLAICSGLGLAALLKRLAGDRSWVSKLCAGAACSVLLIEYLCIPFPVTKIKVPTFFQELAEQPGDGVILDLPMGRQPAKISMYWQTVHEHPIVDGHVSRTPPDVYEWVDSYPVLHSLRACERSLPPADLAPLLPQLVGTGIEYVAVHKMGAVRSVSIPIWSEAQTREPLYEDNLIVVYPVDEANAPLTDAPQLLESCIVVQSIQGTTAQVEPGDVWNIELLWATGNLLHSGHEVELALADSAGQIVAVHQFDIDASKPTNEWERWEQYEASYEFPLDPSLTPGRYSLQVTVIPPDWGGEELLTAQLIEVQVTES